MALCVCVFVCELYEHVDNNRDIFLFGSHSAQCPAAQRNIIHRKPIQSAKTKKQQQQSNRKKKRKKRNHLYTIYVCGNSGGEDACQNMVMGHNDVLLP